MTDKTTDEVVTRKERLTMLRTDIDEAINSIQHLLQENFIDDKTKNEAEDKMREIERKEEHEVLWDLEDGKPKYSNKEKRDNEVANRLKANTTYQDLFEIRKRMSERISGRKDDIEVLKYRFRGVEAKIRIEELLGEER